MTFIPTGPEADEVFFVKSEIFVVDIGELLVDDGCANDEKDGDCELENDQYFSK
jgi:hypothetical protein